MSSIKSYAVIGLGVFGESVARGLAQEGMEVMVIDNNKESINSIAPEVTYAMQLDVTNEVAMKNAGLERMDSVIIAIGEELQASVMATLLCKEMGIPQIVVKTKTEIGKRILERVGADIVVLPEAETGFRLAKNLVGNFKEFFQLSDTMSIVEIPVKAEWIGKTLRELDFRNKYRLNIVAIKSSNSEKMDNFPNPDYKFGNNDMVIAAGANEDLERI